MREYLSINHLGLLLGPILFFILYLGAPQIVSEEADPVIFLALWMIIWWISEAVSISVTALLPLTLFPLLGVMELKSVAVHYSNPIVYLFFGGFVIALALEKVQLHKRIALSILKLTGTKADGVILGFMLSTALMSMWISNTASTVVMLPIAVSVISLLINDEDGFTKKDKNFALAIMLGIAFSANIGGMSTLVGTPPNVVMLGFFENRYGINIGFFQWMQMGVPFSLLLLGVTYLFLTKVFYPNHLGQLKGSGSVIDAELKKLGPMRREEIWVLTIFILTALLWMGKGQLKLLFPKLNLSDTTISMLAAVSLFAIPYEWKKRKFPLSWEDTQKLPWGILILFGGGLALAAGLEKAGLIDMIGTYISSKQDWSPIFVASILIFLMLFMTELIGNLALVTVLVPLVMGIAEGLEASVFDLVIPVTLASSCAFMLPMATPPNAIVFASGHIKVHEMARIGVFLNLFSVVLLIAWSYFVIPLIFS